jgi:hypothetical protein
VRLSGAATNEREERAGSEDEADNHGKRGDNMRQRRRIMNLVGIHFEPRLEIIAAVAVIAVFWSSAGGVARICAMASSLIGRPTRTILDVAR